MSDLHENDKTKDISFQFLSYIFCHDTYANFYVALLVIDYTIFFANISRKIERFIKFAGSYKGNLKTSLFNNFIE